jgi:LysR family transcriptional regulator, hydrogen peroxide-inducible genes activator
MQQVRYFVAMAEELNFTRAAERCHVSQPALTRAIRLLEAELGGQLFHRERKRTHLSELGRMVLPHLREIYTRADQAKREASELVDLTRASLRLGLMCTIAPASLLGLIKTLRQRHPGIELQLTDATASHLHECLTNGELEIALSCTPDDVADERLHRIPLFREQFVVVVSPEHRLATANAIRVCDLDGEHYLERINCEYAQFAERIFTERGVSDRTVYRSDRDDWILAMAAAGLGYAFMPQHCASHPEVVVRPLIEPEIWREISLITVRGRPHSAAVGALVSEARHWFRRASANVSKG